MKYATIYVDPPWSFKVWSEKGMDRSPDYHCLEFTELKALRVESLAAENCVLFLWAIDPMLPEAFELIRSWGFEYKTVAFYWVKLNSYKGLSFHTGLGYWTRANPEQCLLATRGKPKRLAKNVNKLIISERCEHSRKPNIVRDQIERLVPGPYLELFARETKPGWDAFGNQVGIFSRDSLF